MEKTSNVDDVYDDMVSTSPPPLTPPEPMTETIMRTITTQKGKFIDPSASRSMEKYAYHDRQMDLSPSTTPTMAIELPGDIASELALPYYANANVEWPKPKSNNVIINIDDDDDDDGPIACVKRLKLDTSNSYAQLTERVEETTKRFDAMLKSTVTSSRGESDPEADLQLSGVWLRRWSHDGSKVATKPEEVVPSAAAMAMVERARNGSRPCQRRKAYIFRDYWEDIGTIKSFYDANLALADEDSLMMGADYYQTESEIASLLAQGKVPMGIGKNTKISNCIIDKDARIGKDMIIKNKDGVVEADRPDKGFYIRSGITIITEKATIVDGTVI